MASESGDKGSWKDEAQLFVELILDVAPVALREQLGDEREVSAKVAERTVEQLCLHVSPALPEHRLKAQQQQGVKQKRATVGEATAGGVQIQQMIRTCRISVARQYDFMESVTRDKTTL